MSLRPLVLPDDFSGIEALIDRLYDDPDWGMHARDIDDLLDMFVFLRTLWQPITFIRWLRKNLRDTLLGFVWETEDEIVGVAMYDRLADTEHWQLALLAVIPAFRGRGIATRLVDAVIRDVDARGGYTIKLEVGGESESARLLFERMGFETYNGFIEYDYSDVGPTPPATLPPDYSMFPLGYYASMPRFELAKRITPMELARFDMPRLRDFQRNQLWWGLRRLSLFVQNVHEREIMVRSMIDNVIVARGGTAVRARWGDISEIAMRVDPEHAEVVPFLFHHLVSEAQRLGRRRRIEMICPIWQKAVIDYAEAHGFQRLSIYYMMGIILRPDKVAEEQGITNLPPPV